MRALGTPKTPRPAKYCVRTTLQRVGIMKLRRKLQWTVSVAVLSAALPAARAQAPAEDTIQELERRTAGIEKKDAAASGLAGEFVDIPGGTFQMGCSLGQRKCDDNERPVHTASIHAFRMGIHEVTQAQWRAVMGENPSFFSNCGGDCPVERVSFDDVKGFIAELNRQTGQNYRLPSEAEWEYACRAGKTQTYCGSDDVDTVAWYYGNTGNQTHAVGKKKKNDFGLYDMSGNVWEFTEDCWHPNYSGATSNGAPWLSDICARRVLRGGSWDYTARRARSSNRRGYPAGNLGDGVGFRLAQDL